VYDSDSDSDLSVGSALASQISLIYSLTDNTLTRPILLLFSTPRKRLQGSPFVVRPL
jgi:hypothetical protein